MVDSIKPSKYSLENKQDYLFYEMFAAYTKKNIEREEQNKTQIKPTHNKNDNLSF